MEYIGASKEVQVEDEYLTPKEVAERLKVTDQAVYKWIREGKIEGYRFGRAVRIPRPSLEAFVQASREVAEMGKAAA